MREPILRFQGTACGVGDIDAGMDCVVGERSIGHRSRVPGTRAVSEVNPRSEVLASQGSVCEAGSRGGASFPAQRPSFPNMRVESLSSRFRVTVHRSIWIPGAPNKTPEPTTTAVTPRATAPCSEMKRRTEIRLLARVVPAVVVAHLRRWAKGFPPWDEEQRSQFCFS
jgi:hypothetical protein